MNVTIITPNMERLIKSTAYLPDNKLPFLTCYSGNSMIRMLLSFIGERNVRDGTNIRFLYCFLDGKLLARVET